MRLWPRKQVYVDDLPRTHDIRFATVFILLFALVVGLLYAVGFFVAGDRLPRGTTVAGVDVGGMRRGEARAELQDALIPRLERPITARVLNETFEINPQLAGMTFDLEATLSDGLAGERWDPRHMLKVVMGGDDLPAVVDVDQVELDDTLTRIASRIERPSTEASVDFEAGQPVVEPAAVGIGLDYAAAGHILERALLSGEDEVRLPTDPLQPDISTGEATAFADGVASRAVSGPVRVRVADTVLTVPPAVFTPALDVVSADGRLKLQLDPNVLAIRSGRILAQLPHTPANARIAFENGHPVVVPGRSGTKVLPADWAAAVSSAIRKVGDVRGATAVVTPEPPDFTTADARNLGVKERIAWAQVRVPADLMAQAQASAGRLDGTLVRPGADFGYLERVQSTDSWAVASAAFEAAFRGGMSSIERYAPATPVPGTEPGLDARVAPGIGLSWRNATPYGVYIRTWTSVDRGGAGSITVQLWSTRYWKIRVDSSGRYNVVEPRVERSAARDCRPREGSTGFDIDVQRSLRGEDGGHRVETVHSSYAVVDTVVCRRR